MVSPVASPRAQRNEKFLPKMYALLWARITAVALVFLSRVTCFCILLLLLFFFCSLCFITLTRILVGWLFLGLGALSDNISVYIGSSPKERDKEKRNDRREKKCPNNPPPATTASLVGPCPTFIQISRTPRHWKFIQHHRTTRPPP